MTGFLVFQIMSELTANGVQIYHFPVDDETVADTNNTMNVSKGFFLSSAVANWSGFGPWLWLMEVYNCQMDREGFRNHHQMDREGFRNHPQKDREGFRNHPALWKETYLEVTS